MALYITKPGTSLRNRLAAGLPPISSLLRGSLLREYHEGCPCHPNGRYGPYWRLSVNCGGHTRMYQLRQAQVPEVRRAIKNYERWCKTFQRIIELNIQIALSKEARPHAPKA